MDGIVSTPEYDASTDEGRRWDVELRGPQLKPLDLAPRLAEELSQYGPTEPRWKEIALVLSELITNAIEHGALGMDGSGKEHPDEFAAYCKEFDRRLDEAGDDDWVRVEMWHDVAAERLFIRVADSGEGFDFKTARRRKAGSTELGGRGLVLLEHYCETIEHSGHGNICTVSLTLDAD